MNILMVFDYLPERIEGGADRILYEHSTRLKDRGHLIKVIASGSGEYPPDDFFPKDIEIVRYKADKNPLLRLFRTLSGSRRSFEKLSGRVKFDVINFHCPLPAFSILCAKKSKDIFKVYTFHSPWHKEYEIESGSKAFLYRTKSFLRRKLEKFCLDRCDKIIVLSGYMKDEVIKIHNIPGDKIRVIPGGVDTGKFRPAFSKAGIREKLSLPKNKFIMLSIRRLVKRTGMAELIIAARPLIERDDNAILLIAGDGPRKTEVENLITKFNLTAKIILTGFVSEDALPFYYQASDLFVMPTQELEGFGLVILEALSSGLPVLATPIGGIPEILTGLDRRCLFEGTSSPHLTKGLEGFLKDRETVRSIAGKARGYAVGRYSWDGIIPDVEREFTR